MAHSETITATASGDSSAVFANRDASLFVQSADWASETADLEHSDNGTDWQASKDASGNAIQFSANDTVRVPGGFYYRLGNKSGSTAVVRLSVVKGRGNGNG